MAQMELIPERTADGRIILRAVEVGPMERLRRLLRRMARGV